jgi:hypothetical protein
MPIPSSMLVSRSLIPKVGMRSWLLICDDARGPETDIPADPLRGPVAGFLERPAPYPISACPDRRLAAKIEENVPPWSRKAWLRATTSLSLLIESAKRQVFTPRATMSPEGRTLS